jgi:PAS domain S-box-containing protein
MDRGRTKEQLLQELSTLRRQLEELQVKAAAAPSSKRQQRDSPPQIAVPLSSRLTEWKQVDDVLRDKAELFDLAHDSIMVRDLEGRILFWNTGAELHYGWRKEEAVGQISHALLQTRFPIAVEDIIRDLSIKSWWEGELVHTMRNGDPIVVASRWTPLRDEYGQILATLEINSDISARKHMEREIEEKSNRLQEVNAALKALLRQRDDDRKELEDAIATNIETLITPYLKRLKMSPLSSTQRALVEVVESHLRELTSKFLRSIVLDYRILTPAEMRIAVLVREGKTTKEIADLLCISEKTASFHRDNIRTKLGLRGKRINLRSHLLSLP